MGLCWICNLSRNDCKCVDKVAPQDCNFSELRADLDFLDGDFISAMIDVMKKNAGKRNRHKNDWKEIEWTSEQKRMTINNIKTHIFRATYDNDEKKAYNWGVAACNMMVLAYHEVK